MSFPRRSALLTACVALLLAIHFWLGVSAALQKSVTADETAHLAGGYSYWKFNDYRLQPENGNLPQRWAALPLLLEHPRLEPADHPFWWSVSHVWLISNAFFFDSGNSPDFMMATARASMTFWTLATGLLVFFWARRLWGNGGGLFSLALYVFSATTLAHGPLITSDMTVNFFLLAAVGAYWRHLQRMSVGSLALSLAVIGFATVAKFSFLLLIPICGLLILWRFLENTPLTVSWPGREKIVHTRIARAGFILASVGAHVLTAWFIIWLCFGFRFSAFSDGLPKGLQFYMPWEVVMPPSGLWHTLIDAARGWHLLPDAYLQGFCYVKYAAAERSAFLNGDYSNTGWYSFFPYAFLIKTPVAELAAAALALIAACLRWRGRTRGHILADLRRVAPLLALFTVYWIFSITSHLNIGHRHILPTYAPLFIVCGLLARPVAKLGWRIGAGALALLAAGTALGQYPDYLSYFNAFGGGPANGYRHLSDSSLDWGQDLPGLATWLKNHRWQNEPVYLGYFGMGSPAYEGINAEPLAPYYYHHQPRKWTELQPGLYCISATLLQDVYSPWRGPWTAGRERTYQVALKRLRAEIASGQRTPDIAEFGEGVSEPLWNLDRMRFARLAFYLRLRQPDAIIGYSIFVYRINAEEVRVAVDGSLTELADLMERALAQKPGP